MRHGNSIKKYMHGSLAIAITVLVIAAVILFNTFFTSLARANLWTIDMTKGQLYSLSDPAKETLSEVKDPVNIYFAAEESELWDLKGSGVFEATADGPAERTVGYWMSYITRIAKEIGKEYDNVNVEFHDVVKNPDFFRKYLANDADVINLTDVVIESNGKYRLLTYDSFLAIDRTKYAVPVVWGIKCEAAFAATMLSLTASETYKVCFTEGHMERSLDEISEFRNLCEEAGFVVETIDLSKEEIGDDVLLLVIVDPVTDFIGLEGGENANEIDKLDDFLSGYGSVMLFTSPENSGNLANISEMLHDKWGVEFCPGESIKEDSSYATDPSGREFFVDYVTEDTLGKSFYYEYLQQASSTKTIVSDVMPLKLTDENQDRSINDFTYTASSVFLSHPESLTVKDGETVSEGARTVMSVTRMNGVIEAKDYDQGYFAVCGSPSFISNSYLLNSNKESKSAYANRSIFKNAVQLLGRTKVLSNIDAKPLEDTNLNITMAETKTWTVALGIVIPLIIGAAGFAVCYRRRRR